MSNNMMSFLTLVFRVVMETARRSGNKGVFDKMERQVAWLDEQKLNKYR